MRRVDQSRFGIVLLEVLIAMLLLGTAGAALVSVAAQSMHTLSLYELREQEVRDAGNLLSRFAVMRSGELRGWFGERRVGSFTVRMQPRGSGLIDVAILTNSTGNVVLRTTLYPADDGAHESR